ncbi:MAG: bifunctional DNA-formamidopyrimidine glycosylase/DNA-(apurinic or apyrimidinic site) lyase [Gammaproteobacteria bacterium]
MPELPEVETTRRGISPHVIDKKINKVITRQRQLRWPIPRNLNALTKNQKIKNITRRGKYLLFQTDAGHIILHLGMSGSLRIVANDSIPKKHDHVDFVFSSQILRFHDPRRFGTILWTCEDPLQHKLLLELGPEPLNEEFNGAHLHTQAKTRKVNVKNFIMNSYIVVGVGNIYASEALFLSGIHPQRAAGRISAERYIVLAENIKKVLQSAIEMGGTTLRDFVREDGKPGYFANQLNVYNKKGQPCPRCNTPIQARVLGQRSSFFCKNCQH